MNSDDLLLGKADQLMQRHRSFGASESAGEQDLDEGLPLLTEVVTDDQGPRVDRALRPRVEQLLALQRAAILREFERWLDEQLPQVVTSAMDGITDRLLDQITRRARAELLPRLEAMAAQIGTQAEETVADGDGAKGSGQPV